MIRLYGHIHGDFDFMSYSAALLQADDYAKTEAILSDLNFEP